MTTSFVTAHSPQASLPTSGRPLRILYADDMKELRELITLVLGRDGHHVDVFPNGNVALERVRNSAPDHYDLIITDHHMPEMNGLELVQQLRAHPFPGKVVVFSSEISPAIHEKYRQLSVDRILPKPIFPTQLRTTLRDLFAAQVPPSA
jgi:CheY-like chemotaxis protein